MAGKSRVTAGDQQRDALLTLAHSRDRGEADWARAILLTLSGWTSPRIAEAFSVREDTVRLWRSEFARGGVEALKATVAPGPPPVKTEAALRVVAPLLEAPVADRPNWTIPRLMAEIEAREGVKIASRSCPRRCEKKLPLAAAPAHAERPPDCGRDRTRGTAPSTAQGSGRSRRHHPPLRRRERGPDAPLSGAGWALRGADLRVPAPGQAKKVAIIGSLDHVTRQLIVHTSQTKRSRDFIAHLEQLDHLFGPQPGRAIKPVVLVEDNGPIHVSKLTLKAIEARKHWLTVEWLPKYAPELNDIEVVWHDLKARHLAHQTFADADALDRAIHAAVAALNRERTINPLVIQRISA